MDKDLITMLLEWFYNIFSTIAAVALSIFAGIGLFSWKTQARGKDRYEAAKKAMLAIYSVRTEFARVRKGFMDNAEIIAALKELGISEINHKDSDFKRNYMSAVYKKRIKELNESFNLLDFAFQELFVITNQDIGPIKTPLVSCYNELYYYIVQHIQIQCGDIPQTDNFTTKHRDMVIFEQPFMNESNDDFGSKISIAISSLEAEVRKHL